MNFQAPVTAFPPPSLAERKAWALRQGNPLWLWPEVRAEDWGAALLEIERACAAVMAGKRAPSLAGDPAAFGLAGYTSGMGPRLGQWLEEGLLSASRATAEVFEQQWRANSMRMNMLLGRAREVTERLAAQEIAVTVLKGAHTASVYFPHIGCRPMSDIDILVCPDDADATARILEGLGYRQTAKSFRESTWTHGDSAAEPCSLVSLEADDPWAIDLHISLDVPGPPGAAPARLSQTMPAVESCHAIPGAQQLAQPLLLLHLATHAGSGFHNLTLVRLLEIAMVAWADRASGALSWDEFAELGAATTGLAFAYPALALARQLSPDDIPHETVERCAGEAPVPIRRLVGQLRPATAHRIDRPSLREHFGWTRGPGGWLRRLAADCVPEPGSLRRSAAIHGSRARALWRQGINRPRP